MHHSESVTIDTNAKFELEYAKKVQLLLMSPPVNRGPAHAMRDDTTALTHELSYVTESFSVDPEPSAWREVVKPNLPWAEDHFQERVSKDPLNPPPSEAYWPFARQGNAEHKKDQKFSHTYPERFWPRFAGKTRDIETVFGDSGPEYEIDVTEPHQGIRFEYGSLDDIRVLLGRNINTRQAYLPVWFPEDLTAAVRGERVPCSMGYHFISNRGKLDCVYTLRSCDIVRFYRDDVYMAGRLLQWITQQVGTTPPGKLVVHIDNLHCFPGDRPHLEKFLPLGEVQADRRASYNFDAL